eukprot:4551398-Amphidinium_carterae.1
MPQMSYLVSKLQQLAAAGTVETLLEANAALRKCKSLCADGQGRIHFHHLGSTQALRMIAVHDASFAGEVELR